MMVSDYFVEISIFLSKPLLTYHFLYHLALIATGITKLCYAAILYKTKSKITEARKTAGFTQLQIKELLGIPTRTQQDREA